MTVKFKSQSGREVTQTLGYPMPTTDRPKLWAVRGTPEAQIHLLALPTSPQLWRRRQGQEMYLSLRGSAGAQLPPSDRRSESDRSSENESDRSRDPRDPNYAKFHGVSPADMNIEMFRRLFEQNQRLETSLLELRKELQEVRKELKQK